MKYNIVFKFIAVLLCAAALLGILFSAGSMVVLTQLDLYNKDVYQIRQERIESYAEDCAAMAAQQYATIYLGGFPEGWYQDNHSYFTFDNLFEPNTYAYSILDENGAVVYTEGTALEGAHRYTFQPQTQYRYLVSSETETERQNSELEQIGSHYLNTSTAGGITYENIPEYGISVGYAALVSNGDVLHEASGSDSVGFLYRSESGSVIYRGAYGGDSPDFHGATITDAIFTDGEGNLCYQASNLNGVGSIFFQNGDLVFESIDAEDMRTKTPVTNAFFYGLTPNIECGFHSSEAIGEFYYDEAGCAVFECWAPESNLTQGSLTGMVVYSVELYDEMGEILYSLQASDPIGTTYLDSNGNYVFQALYPAFALASAEAPEETVSETMVAATVPETQATEAAEETTAPETTLETEAEEETKAEDPTEETKAKKKKDTDKETAEETREQSSPSAVPEDPEESKPSKKKDKTKATEPAVAETAEATAETTVPETTAAETVPETTVPAETVPEATQPVMINGKPLEEYSLSTDSYWDSQQQERVYLTYVYTPLPAYTVEVCLLDGALGYEWEYDIMSAVRAIRSYLPMALGICLLIFAIMSVYLCCAAGRKPKQQEIKAGGLNCIPLDLYFCLVIGGMVLLVGLANFLFEQMVHGDLFTTMAVAAMGALLGCLLIVGFCFACAAQFKTPEGYWLRNILTIRCLMLGWKACIWCKDMLIQKFFPWLIRVCKVLIKWNTALVLWTVGVCKKCLLWAFGWLKRFFSWCHKSIDRGLTLLPLMWQWLLAGFTLMLFTMIISTSHNAVVTLLGLGICVALVLFISTCFGKLLESTKRMSKGDLDTEVQDPMFIGCFKEFASDLNDLGDVAVVAAQKQLRSERMKTELITNVSHDIKTPLTSIINYVDLLQKPHTEQEQEAYLEVLDRQSQRLKKLIDDLMEMSKASTGNITVDISRVDAVESVSQALGEFSDKLNKAQLYPVFRHTEDSVPMMADGKLVWRVLSNLLSNAVKYAMPGTRLYIDLMQLEGKVILSLKNISRDELNVDAEELMERFVRGDDARNTEGSGLGLNIAKSLVELQKGQLQLLVDGDLFKVTLIFPGI